MDFTSKVRQNIAYIRSELKELQRVSKGQIGTTFVSIGNPEFDTISYKLGKTLIDAKKDLPSAISTPRKLFTIYLESKNRRSARIIEKKAPAKRVEIYKGAHFKTMNDFLHSSSSDAYHSDFNNINDFIKTFGVNSGKKIVFLEKNKIFFENDESQTIYTSSKNFWKVNEIVRDMLYLNFTFDVSTNLDVVVIISFFGANTEERLSYNMLPINKGLNLKIPENVSYFSLGLRVKGQGIVNFKNVTANFKKNSCNAEKGIVLDDGVSVIIPSYKGERTVVDTLMSIKNQKNIDLSLIEVIVVVNGERDNTIDKVQNFSENNPELDINCSYIDKIGASSARNYAIAAATKKYTIFCDDDDLLSEEYIAALYKTSSIDAIGFCRIYDLTESDQLIKQNTINNKLLNSLERETEDLSDFTSAITMIASKILPTENLKKISFNEKLRSGEDVVFFTKYYSNYRPRLIMSTNENAYYIRRLRDDSVSRQQMSFDFNVEQRLDVIKDLTVLKKYSETERHSFIDDKIRAQCGFIVKYLQEYGYEYRNVHLEIVKRQIEGFPYRYIQDRLGYTSPELLVISYCHPPFVDTSAVVTAKRVFEFNQLCDVMCADMSEVRSINPELVKIDQHLVRDSFVISTPVTFGGWEGIYDFCTSVNLLTDKNKKYKKLYSRSFWPASHFAALEYKRKNPSVYWIAEFSDPVFFDIEGNPRKADISQQWVEDLVNEFKLSTALLEELNLYVWCELIVYLFADEVIFTCENQEKLMLSKFPHREKLVSAKAVPNIKPHPTLPTAFYESCQTDYLLDNSKVNFAYFGAFYKTRRLDDLIEVIHLYNDNNIVYKGTKPPLVHIFTEQVDEARDMIENEGLQEYFIINSYVGYLEFLTISSSMDVLIVNDAKAKGVFGFNPYLPSKLSDYINSGSNIWAFCEEGSALSTSKKIDYKSRLGDIISASQAFQKLLNEGDIL